MRKTQPDKLKAGPRFLFNPLLAPLAPLAPRDLQNKLYLPQTIMTTYKSMIIK